MKRWGEVDIVVFDWNGTLLADAERAWHSIGDVLSRHGLPALDFDEFGDGFRLPVSEWLASLGVAKQSLASAEAAWNRGMGVRPAELQPGARRLLTRINESGRAVAVVSAASADTLEADSERLELDGLIGVMVGDASDKASVLRRVVNGRAGIYVGDAEYDVEEGRRAKLLTVAFTGGYRSRDDLEASGADAVVDRLSEVGDLMGLP